MWMTWLQLFRWLPHTSFWFSWSCYSLLQVTDSRFYLIQLDPERKRFHLKKQNQFLVNLYHGKPTAIVFPPITMGSLLKSPAVQARSTWGKQMRKVKIKNANKKRVRVNNAKYVSAFSFCGCPPHTKMFYLFMILSRNMLTFLHFSLS